MAMDKLKQSLSMKNLAFLMILAIVAILSIVSSVYYSGKVSAAPGFEDKVLLAKSDRSNESLRLNLKDYPMKATHCAAIGPPWQPGNGGTGQTGSNLYDGDIFDKTLSCSTRFTTGGAGKWVPKSQYGNWATSITKPSVFNSNSVITSVGNCEVNSSSLVDQVEGVDTIWSQCAKLNSSEKTAQYTSDLWKTPLTSIGNWRVFSSGSTLFRKTFTLSEAQCTEISGGVGRVFLKITGDDWYIAYINGHELVNSKVTRTGSDNEAALGSSLNCSGDRTNVLAVQVVDKTIWTTPTSVSGSNAAGLRYKLSYQISTTANWTLTPTTTTNVATAKPGDTIIWTHTVRNNGPTSTARNASAAGGANISGTDTTFTQTPWTINSGFVSGAISQKTSSYTVRASDVGNSVCRGTSVSNYTQANTGWTGWRDIKCVSVAYNFNLVPTINIPGGNVIEPGSNTKINVTGNVNNNGLTKSRPGGNWQISRIVFNGTPSATQKQGGESSTEACGWSKYNSGKRNCNKTNEGTWTGSINNGSNFSNGMISEFVAEDEPVGTTVCFVLSIQPYAEGSSGWRHSNLQCITYGKKPKVQVWGGDVIVGRSIDGATHTSKIETSLSVKNNKYTETKTSKVKEKIKAGGPVSDNDVSGLWRTGVNASNAKAAVNVSDAHWYVRSVFNNGPARSAICAKGYTLTGGALTGPIRNSNYTSTNTPPFGILNWRAMTIGNDNVWNNNPSNARWVGLNQTGRDYPINFTGDVSGDCSAPARNGVFTNANTYIFRLRQPIKISSEVLIDSDFKLTMKGAVDNVMKVFVNGCELRAAPGVAMSSFQTNWMQPGWYENSQAAVTAQTIGACSSGSRGFKHGDNTLEVHVRSDWTYTGLLIKDFSIDGYKEVEKTETVTIDEDKTFGSWGEYGLVANGQIKGMASGAAFHPLGIDSDSSGAPQSSWSKLTFANVFKTNPTAGGCNSTSPWGCYAHKASMPNIESLFSGGTSLGTGVSNVSVNSLKGQVNTKTGGTINISGGTLNSGEWTVINAPTSTVNITGNINYASGPVNSVKDIPQMIIIANNINISPSVGNVDSWLIAKNALATCDEIGSASDLNTTSSAYNLSSNDCKSTLRVNGPVMAKKLWLRRTAGAGTGDSTGDPAEVFNYRPDAMLWINNRFNNNALRTTNLTELPPRY